MPAARDISKRALVFLSVLIVPGCTVWPANYDQARAATLRQVTNADSVRWIQAITALNSNTSTVNFAHCSSPDATDSDNTYEVIIGYDARGKAQRVYLKHDSDFERCLSREMMKMSVQPPPVPPGFYLISAEVEVKAIGLID